MELLWTCYKFAMALRWNCYVLLCSCYGFAMLVRCFAIPLLCLSRAWSKDQDGRGGKSKDSGSVPDILNRGSSSYCWE